MNMHYYMVFGLSRHSIWSSEKVLQVSVEKNNGKTTDCESQGTNKVDTELKQTTSEAVKHILSNQTVPNCIDFIADAFA